MAKNKPVPKTQAQIFKEQTDAIASESTPILPNLKKRELQRTVKDDDVKRLHIGLRDIDETIVFYFNKFIRPSVIQNGSKINVPVLYGSPERWKAVQKDPPNFRSACNNRRNNTNVTFAERL